MTNPPIGGSAIFINNNENENENDWTSLTIAIYLQKNLNEIKAKMIDDKTNKNGKENEIMNENTCLFWLIFALTAFTCGTHSWFI